MQSGLRLQGNRKKNSFVNSFENQFLPLDKPLNNSKVKQSSQEVSQEQEEDDDYQEDQSNDKITQKKQLVLNNQIQIKNQTSNPQINGVLKIKIDKQKQQNVIKKVKDNYNNITANISQLKNQYNDINIQQALFYRRNIDKQRQIKLFLKQKKKEKRKREKRIIKIKQAEEKKRIQNLKIIEEQQKVRKKPAESSKLITKDKRYRQKEQREQKQKIVQQFVKKFQVNKRFHQRKLEEDVLKQKQQQKQHKKKLIQHKQRFRPLDYQTQFEEHQRKRQQMLRNLEQIKLAQKQERIIKIIQANNKLQQNIYRGHSHELIQQEMESLKNKKKQPLQRYQSIKKYQKYVRENFLPKTQKNQKSSQLSHSNIMSKTHREVRRYRYFQGHSYGQIVQNRPIAKSQAQQRKIGNSYLNYLKSLPKRSGQKKTQQYSPKQLKIVEDKLNKIVKVTKQRNPLYDGRKKSLEIKISQQPTRDELNMAILQLKNFDDKMKQKQKVVVTQKYPRPDELHQKRKEINQNIIDNIQRKLSLLSKL